MDKEKIEKLSILSALYCILTKETPETFLKDVWSECELIKQQIDEYIDSLECSKITKTIFVEPILEVHDVAIKNIKTMFNGDDNNE